MRTDNLKKLITAEITTNQMSSSTYSPVMTPLSGAFKDVTGTNVSTTIMDAIYDISTATLARLLGGVKILQAMVIRPVNGTNPTPTFKSWSSLVAGGKEAAHYGMQTYISATYDADDQPISSADYAMRGTNVSATIVLQNNGTVTVTFSNGGKNVLHANRIGITGVLQEYGTASNSSAAKYALLYIFAFDDIALAPGETKSITIQPDLD